MSSHTVDKLILPRFIAITGQEGSGKDLYGGHLENLGYLHISAGDFLREIARKQGHRDPIDRKVLSDIGDKLKEQFGSSPITEASLARYEKEKSTYPAGLAISGLRRPGEVSTAKKHGAIVLWIVADEETSYRNIGYRLGETPDREAFTARRKLEYNGETDGGKDGVNLRAIEAMADVKVTNDASKMDLLNNGDDALYRIASNN